MVDFQSGYNRLYAFLTDQHRIHFPETVQPSFAPPGEAAEPARTDSVPTPEPIPAATPQLTLLRELALAPDDDLAAEASDEMTGVAFVIPIKLSDVLTGSGFGRTALYAGVAKAKERTEPRS